MATRPTPLAGSDSPVQSPGTDATPPSRLAGDMGGADTAQPQAAPDQGMAQAVAQVRDMQSTLMDMARQFPSAASALRQAMEGLRAALRQMIANPGSPEPPAPQIGG